MARKLTPSRLGSRATACSRRSFWRWAMCLALPMLVFPAPLGGAVRGDEPPEGGVRVAQLLPGDEAPLAPLAAGDAAPGLDLVPRTAAREKPQPAGRLNLDAQVEGVLSKKYPADAQDLRIIQQQVQRILSEVLPATISVELADSSASGVVVTADGLVLTASHVAGEAQEQVTFIFPDGRRVHGKALGANHQSDAAMLKITDKGSWPHVKIAGSQTLRPGDWVIATGQPGGFALDRTPPVRLGRVLKVDDEVISTDCTLVGGDSGGPLFNLAGEVVGIHSRIGLQITSNFHVPISAYHDVWDRLLAGQTWGQPLASDEPVHVRPFLGVAGSAGKDGCRVTQVFPNMPAATAGIQVGDVVRTFDGETVVSFEQLSQLLFSRRPGDTVPVEVERQGETHTVDVRLGTIDSRLPGGAKLRQTEAGG